MTVVEIIKKWNLPRFSISWEKDARGYWHVKLYAFEDPKKNINIASFPNLDSAIKYVGVSPIDQELIESADKVLKSYYDCKRC